MSRKAKKDLTKKIAQELDVFDGMLTSLIELLEEKGILTQEEWENRIKLKIEKNTRSYREIQFKERYGSKIHKTNKTKRSLFI